MRKSLALSLAYVKYYKKQSAALFLGILLSAALLTGVGSLFGSGRAAAYENAKETYGSWQYSMWCSEPWFQDFLENPKGKGFQIQKYGVLTIKKIIEEPYKIEYACADQGYLDLMDRSLKEGKLPEEASEIAMDSYTLRNLEIPEKLGSQVQLDGETFSLCGILTDLPSGIQKETMQVLVSDQADYGTAGDFLYLQFREDKNVTKQIGSFADTYQAEKEQIKRNNEVVGYLSGCSPKEVWEILKTGFSYKETGLPYIWGSLNENGGLTEKAVLLVLGLFGAFILYSLFQVSLLRRLSQYSVMQTLGAGEGSIFGALFGELALLFAVGYPAGCLLGNGAAAWIYQRAGQIFIPQGTGAHSSVDAVRETLLEQAAEMPEAGNFQVNVSALLGGALFFLALLALISFFLLRKMRSLTLRQMITKETGIREKRRKIYSKKRENLTGILAKEFLFSQKGMFAGILFSLSVGSVIFLGTFYIMENSQRNNALTFKADDGLGSDLEVSLETDDLEDSIPEECVEQMRQVPGVSKVYPVRYLLGEIPLEDGIFQWPEFYAETANQEGFEPDPELMEKYGGVIVQTGEADYRLKVNVYGYDEELLKLLNDYLLEGEIDPEEMKENDGVIFKTLSDGQGHTDGISLHVKDSLSLKTPAKTGLSAKGVLTFNGEDGLYEERNLEICAMVNRPLAKVKTFIGDESTSQVDLILTNEQMERYFGRSGYQTVSISLKEGADPEKAAGEIKKLVSGVKSCVVKDYTAQIQTQNFYLLQKMLFFYGIAAVLLVISLVHILNSMQYLVAARRHELGILRAMGITDAGFLKMLAREGIRCGIFSSLVTIVLYLAVQKVLYYFLLRVYLYVQPSAWISLLPLGILIGVNVLLCLAAVLLSGRSVLKQSVIEEIRE